MIEHKLTLTRVTERHLNEAKLKDNLGRIKSRVLTEGRKKRGWDARFRIKKPESSLQGISYKVELFISCQPKRKRAENIVQEELDKILQIIASSAGSRGWVIGTNGEALPEEVKERVQELARGTVTEYAEVVIPPNWRDYFSAIYGRDDQIEIVMAALHAAVLSDWYDRFNCALVGSPASGKTSIALTLRDMLGEDAVLIYDATATTQAGAIEDLRTRDKLPRIIVIEEIEKAPEDSLRWLLGVLDQRAQINKVNFRGAVQKEVRAFGVCTANDDSKFKNLLSGAVASRFPNQINCPQPDREILRRILLREVTRANGSGEWIEPALDFAEKEKITDPRKVTAICLCGRDELLSGTYQERLRKTRV